MVFLDIRTRLHIDLEQQPFEYLHTNFLDVTALREDYTSTNTWVQLLMLSRESCVPSQVVSDKSGVNLRFKEAVELTTDEYVLNQIKSSGSIQLQLIKASTEDVVNEFDWTIQQLDSTSIRIAITFSDPLRVSDSSAGDDVMRLLLKDTSLFLTCQQQRLRFLKTAPSDLQLFTSIPAI